MDGAAGDIFPYGRRSLEEGGVEADLEVSSWRVRWLERASRSNRQWD